MDGVRQLTDSLRDRWWCSDVVVKDFWSKCVPYNGIHLDVHVPGGGCFEIQVHTPTTKKVRDCPISHAAYKFKGKHPDNTMAFTFSNLVGYTMLVYYEAIDRVGPMTNEVLAAMAAMCMWLSVKFGSLSQYLAKIKSD